MKIHTRSTFIARAGTLVSKTYLALAPSGREDCVAAITATESMKLRLLFGRSHNVGPVGSILLRSILLRQKVENQSNAEQDEEDLGGSYSKTQKCQRNGRG